MKSARVVLIALVAACGGSANLPLEAGIGPNPTLPGPRKSLIPVVRVAKAEGWPEARAVQLAKLLKRLLR